MPFGKVLVASCHCTTFRTFQTSLAKAKFGQRIGGDGGLAGPGGLGGPVGPPGGPVGPNNQPKKVKSIEVTAGGATFKCGLPNVATEIVKWLALCRTYCPVRYFACGGYSWHVGWCGKGAEITVGGRGVCGCKARLTIRPCINNPSWGGFGGKTCTARSQQMSVKVEQEGN